jgi:chromate transporter
MLRLGTISFGGPAAHLALIHEELVKRRRWVSEQEYLDLLGASGLIPGPTSTETAIHLGMSRGGWLGLWVAGFCFISPAALITAGFAWAYMTYGSLPAVQGLLLGVKPAVVAVILSAVLQLARTAAKTAPLRLLGLACFGFYLAGVNELALLLGGGLLPMLLRRFRPGRLSALVLPAVGGIGPAAVGMSAVTPSVPGVFLYFLRVGATLFGSGYVLLAFLRQGLVHDLRWLTEQQLLDAVAVGQFTPGPLFSTATFAGYVIGERFGIGGWACAVAASLGIFLPSFMMVWATHSMVRRLRQSPWTAAFLDGVNAASIALMAGVLYQLAASSLALRVDAWLIFAAAAAVIFRYRVNSAWVVLAGALVGLVFYR